MKPGKDMAKGKEHCGNTASIQFCAALEVQVLLTVCYIQKRWESNG